MAQGSKPPVVFPGDRYGMLVVDAEDGRDKHGRRTYRCMCDCGTLVAGIASWNLRSGNTRSCGCRRVMAAIANGHANRRHGHCTRTGERRASPTFRSWCSMLKRVRNPNDPSYPHYGGRGITVCERWLTFEIFLADMGERPEGRTLDRVDNDGNYEPGNCRWATASEQAKNRRPYAGNLARYRGALEVIATSGTGVAANIATEALEG